MGALRRTEGDSLAVAASAPLPTSTSIFLITAISKQPLATSPAWGSGEAEPFATLGEKLIYLGWVGVHVSEGYQAAAGISHLSCIPERKAPSS